MGLRGDRYEIWRLQNVQPEKLPQMGIYGSKLARVLRCIDGDTVKVALVVENSAVVVNVRLCGIDAPEMRPARNNPHREAIKREASAAKSVLEELLPPDSLCTLHCCGPLDCYGRVLAHKITTPKKVEVISEMVLRGYAVRVSDKKRHSDWESMWDALQTQRLLYATKEKNEKTRARRLTSKPLSSWRRLFCFVCT